MQLRVSFPRVLLALFCATLGYFEKAGGVVLALIGVLCLAAGDGRSRNQLRNRPCSRFAEATPPLPRPALAVAALAEASGCRGRPCRCPPASPSGAYSEAQREACVGYTVYLLYTRPSAVPTVHTYCGCTAADMLLAARWWWTAWSASYVAKHPRTLAHKRQARARTC